jgi:hypothetical protein
MTYKRVFPSSCRPQVEVQSSVCHIRPQQVNEEVVLLLMTEMEQLLWQLPARSDVRDSVSSNPHHYLPLPLSDVDRLLVVSSVRDRRPRTGGNCITCDR